MEPIDERELNQAAYRQLKAEIGRTYEHGRFVAISNGRIVGDSADFNDLRRHLLSLGKDPAAVLVVEAGVDYPEHVTIFI